MDLAVQLLKEVNCPKLTAKQETERMLAYATIASHMSGLNGAEYKVIMTLYSDTFEMGQANVRLSYDEFVNGYMDRERGFRGSIGLSKTSVVVAIRKLVSAGVIERFRPANTRAAYTYRINIEDFDLAMHRLQHPVRRRRRKSQ